MVCPARFAVEAVELQGVLTCVLDPEKTYDTPSFDGSGSVHRDVGYAD